ncbi:hypothetical protein OG802_22935 [Streptomyces sp. NBC_00704]|uniref:DUF6542 domain-containing protein n=1 Tax=Streptomyces sp. NBC_00704 TaxID=2975809 RepID=UPI002E35946B|nr:DUF6542 domain-containing protein [Streptomyces sp. NBC_00704]
MEQHRTRPPHQGTRPGGQPLPPQADREGNRRSPHPSGRPGRPGVRRPGTAVPAEPSASGGTGAPGAVRRLPNPRLTGLGGGLFSGTLMFLLGCLDQVLFEGSLTVYSVLFLPVCVLTGLWVRGPELLAAPVVAPIAFTFGLLPVARSGDGAGERLAGLVTALATQVGWLYAGTLLAGLTILARGLRRAATRRRTGSPRR